MASDATLSPFIQDLARRRLEVEERAKQTRQDVGASATEAVKPVDLTPDLPDSRLKRVFSTLASALSGDPGYANRQFTEERQNAQNFEAARLESARLTHADLREQRAQLLSIKLSDLQEQYNSATALGNREAQAHIVEAQLKVNKELGELSNSLARQNLEINRGRLAIEATEAAARLKREKQEEKIRDRQIKSFDMELAQGMLRYTEGLSKIAASLKLKGKDATEANVLARWPHAQMAKSMFQSLYMEPREFETPQSYVNSRVNAGIPPEEVLDFAKKYFPDEDFTTETGTPIVEKPEKKGSGRTRATASAEKLVELPGVRQATIQAIKNMAKTSEAIDPFLQAIPDVDLLRFFFEPLPADTTR